MGVILSINDIRNVTSEMARYGSEMDFSGFTFSFLKRRLGHVFTELKVRRLNQFVERLAEADFRENVKYHMAVNVTEMFRDPGFWRSLRHNVFPSFRNQVSVWFPDAASGEELFSLAIILKEDGLLNEVEVLGHHPSKEKCQEIKQGLFDAKNMDLNHSNYRRLEENDCFEDYFSTTDGRMRLKDDLLKNFSMLPSWFGDEEEGTDYDIIIFRNSGINYTIQHRFDIMQKLVDHLKPGGVIALGIKESVPAGLQDLLEPIDEKESIYYKPGVKNS